MIFYNRFVEIDELIEFIGVADIYVTPYLNPAQITSGTLAYAFGCGKAVVSTPYWHAEELLADGRGVLVPFGDADGPGAGDLRAAPRRAAAARHAQEGLPAGPRDDLEPRRPPLHGLVPAGPPEPLDVPFRPLAVRTLAEQQADLPGWRLDHLQRHDRLGRPAPARQLHDSQLRRGLLHRRQRPGLAA